MSRFFTICLDGHYRAALLFGGKDLRAADLDILAIAKDINLKRYFPKGAYFEKVGGFNYSFLSEQDTHLLVSAHPKHRFIPDEPNVDIPYSKTPEDKMELTFNGMSYQVSRSNRYNACLSLFKATGCRSCPEYADKKCLTTALNEQCGVTLNLKDVYTDKPEQLSARLQVETNIVIAGHQYIAPALTKHRSDTFKAALRDFWEHSFQEIEQRREDLSERAVKGAKTRSLRKNMCGTCLIKKHCTNTSWCTGPLPPKEEIIQKLDAEFQHAIQNSSLPEWQLGELAFAAGTIGKKNRWKLRLCGLRLDSNRNLVPSVYRCGAAIKRVPSGFLESYEELAAVFYLPKTEPVIVGRQIQLISEEIRAAYWSSLIAMKTSSTYHPKGSVLISLDLNRLNFQAVYAKDRYIYRSYDVNDLEQVAKYVSYGTIRGVEHIPYKK